MSDRLIIRDASSEEWREYEWVIPGTQVKRLYRILAPVTVHYHKGGGTHRVVDVEGIAHCVPAPGRMGCALRWKTREGLQPVQF